MNQHEDEERETAVDKDARVHFTLAFLAVGTSDPYLNHVLYLMRLLN